MIQFLRNKENRYVLIGFVLSFFHWTLATAFCVGLLFYLKQGIRGGVKALIIMGIRTNIGTVIAATIGSGGMIKFAVIFAISFYLIANSHPQNPGRMRNYLELFALYLVSNMFTLAFNSSFPVTGLFKLISYSVPFYAVVKAVGDDDRYDYIEYMVSWLSVVVVASLVALPIGKFNYVNGDFQGVLNHPNTCGILCGIYVGLATYQLANGKSYVSNRTRMFCILLAFVMIYLSRSRTGMFSALIFVIMVLMTTSWLSFNGKVCLGILSTLIICFYLGLVPEATDLVATFISKRGETKFLQSRDEMKLAFEYKYSICPWMGTGFLVPFYKGYRDLSLSFSIIAEPGNLGYAVVGDSGIIGAALFVLYVGYIVICSGKRKLVLALIPLIISIGEVAFFSTNNFAVWYYVMYGVCLSKDGRNEVSYRQDL